jgi:hypothetical protein
MKITKTTIAVISLIILLLIGFVASEPEFVPTFRSIQMVFILIIYLLIIGLTAIIVWQIRTYICIKYTKKKAAILTKISSFLFITFIFIQFILTANNIKNGTFRTTFMEELHYPGHNISLYIYESNHHIPHTSIKVKDRILPVMHNVAFIEDHRAIELKNWRHEDTVFFIGKKIQVFIDLKSRKARKTYNTN